MCEYSLTADWFWFNPSAFSQRNRVFHLNVYGSGRSRLSQQVVSFPVIASVVCCLGISVKLLTKDILHGCTHDTQRRRRLRLESNCWISHWAVDGDQAELLPLSICFCQAEEWKGAPPRIRHALVESAFPLQPLTPFSFSFTASLPQNESASPQRSES